jgi:hypothetical protein
VALRAKAFETKLLGGFSEYLSEKEILISLAERSFPLLNLLEMFCQPHAQFLLHKWGSLQDHLDKAQSLKDFEVPPGIHNNMCALGAQLLKGKRLARLVDKSPSRLRVGK